MATVLGYLLATVMLVASVWFFAWLFKSVFKSFFGKGYWVVIAAMLVCSWCNIFDSKILSIIAGIAIGWFIKSIFFKQDKTCEDSDYIDEIHDSESALIEKDFLDRNQELRNDLNYNNIYHPKDWNTDKGVDVDKLKKDNYDMEVDKNECSIDRGGDN